MITLQNRSWQVGILPQTGASIAFGRIKHHDEWVDVLRPTPYSDYTNSSNCSSFIMLPWCNRIKDGVLRYGDETYQLQTTKDDGTARHGDVRKREWTVNMIDAYHISMSLNSSDFPDMNWPFAFSAKAEYRLDGAEFKWSLSIKNEDSRAFPTGFGHHPYFVKTTGANAPHVQIPCNGYFELTNYMASGAAVSLPERLDFRDMRPLGVANINDVMTDRIGDEPARMQYPEYQTTLEMFADPLFKHILLYAPEGEPYYAVEPMTNVSDGFNLFAQNIEGSGVFVLESGEEKQADVRLVVRQ
ncbi:MAG: aldose epimerase [Chloroflexi bacterium]|nr:aldose epimerase [Chloroflexota bacterium]MCC6893850.1 aldose epimerase [Anaerolineae bacterium]